MCAVVQLDEDIRRLETHLNQRRAAQKHLLGRATLAAVVVYLVCFDCFVCFSEELFVRMTVVRERRRCRRTNKRVLQNSGKPIKRRFLFYLYVCMFVCFFFVSFIGYQII